MAIHWYPGHMNKARKKIKESMPLIDMVIEVLDARIPYSSENPVIDELRGDTPCITLLNKSDLADPIVTTAWKQYYERERGVKAIAMVADKKGEAKALIQKISQVAKTMLSERNLETKPARIMIMGIPNVGKSTLMNGLLGKVLAKVGNEPAVTRMQQSTRLANGILLFDTPGILWPKIGNEDTSYRLAITGAIKSTAMEFDDVALYAADYLLEYYPALIMARYKLKTLPKDDIGLLEEIGRRRGALGPGGKIDLNKASELLINEFRSGAIGRISLETPELIASKKAKLSGDGS